MRFAMVSTCEARCKSNSVDFVAGPARSKQKKREYFLWPADRSTCLKSRRFWSDSMLPECLFTHTKISKKPSIEIELFKIYN